MTKVEEALAEINAELARIEPIHEGLRDFDMLDITQETRADVRDAIEQYDRRVELLTANKNGLTELLNDGYPELEIAPVEQAVYDDLKANQATITAALAKFQRSEAVTLGLTPGTPEEQP